MTDPLTNGLPTTPARVIVGMSGGVDSSVAALLLKEHGHDVSAIFMQNWDDDDEQCTARQDYRDAQAVCNRLGIRLETVNFEREYWDRVFAHFLEEYSAGRTPNPDILCNKEIKFKAFLNHALNVGCDFIATGHYAQRSAQTDDTPVQLLRGLDSNKDQSYFLYTLGQNELRSSLFPIGALEKPDVRQLANNAGFHVFSKKDSTGICFIGERKFQQFLSEYLPAKPGPIVSSCGKTLGQHQGLMYYTLGQPQGLGIGGTNGFSEEPWYVLDKDLASNTLTVGQGHNHPQLFRTVLGVHGLDWCSSKDETEDFECTAKVRYRQEDQAASVTLESGGQAIVTFAQPVRAATPGQSIVFYADDACLGGGIISDFPIEASTRGSNEAQINLSSSAN